MRRNFLKLLGVSIFSLILLPYKFLHSASKKIINKNLTEEQKIYFLMKGLSVHSLALYFMRKEMAFIIVPIVMQNCLALNQNTIVEQDGHHLQRLFQEHLILKLITHWE